MGKIKGRLLWIVHEGNNSGANIALMENFELLRDMDYHINVISPAKGSFTKCLEEKNISTSVIPMYGWTRPLDKGFFIKGWLKRNLRNTLAIVQIAKLAIGTQAICTNTICTISGALAAKLTFKPHYWFVHEFGEEDHGFSLALPQKSAYRLMRSLSTKIVVNSLAVKQKWTSVLGSAKKINLLYNVVNNPNSSSKDLPPKEYLENKFLMLGQISPAKGHHLAIDSVIQLHKEYPKIALDIIGSVTDESYFLELEAKIDANKAWGYIKIKSPVTNPFAVFHNYKALLMCSRMEAFGRVTVEAMKAGLPVIGLNSGGTKEIINHDVNGFLVEKPYLQNLTSCIAKLLTIDKDSYQSMSLSAMQINTKINRNIAKMQLEDILTAFNDD